MPVLSFKYITNPDSNKILKGNFYKDYPALEKYKNQKGFSDVKLDKDTFFIVVETMHGVNMDYYIYFSNVYSNIKESTQNIRNVALSQYNKIQNELNETAKKQDLAAGNSK